MSLSVCRCLCNSFTLMISVCRKTKNVAMGQTKERQWKRAKKQSEKNMKQRKRNRKIEKIEKRLIMRPRLGTKQMGRTASLP